MKLYLSGKKIDLYKKTVISITIDKGDIILAKTGSISYSNRIKIPKTARNKQAVKLIGTQGVAGSAYQPKHLRKCSILEEGVVNEGYFKLLKTTEKDFEIALYLGGETFFKNLGDLTLRDLDLSEYDHEISPNIIIDSMDNSDGYIYAMANFADFSNKPHLKFLQTDPFLYLPSMYAHTLIEKIVNRAGYTLTQKPCSECDFVVPPIWGSSSKKYEFDRTCNLTIDDEYDVKLDTSTDLNDLYIHYKPLTSEDLVVDEQGEYIMRTEGRGVARVMTEFVDPENAGIRMREIVARWTPKGGAGGYVEEVLAASPTPSLPWGTCDDYVDFNNTKTVVLTNTSFAVYEKVTFINWRGKPITLPIKHNTEISINVQKEVSKNTIKMKDIMPAIAQKDMVKEMMFRNGWTLNVDKGNRQCEFVPIASTINKTEEAIDWSSKFKRLVYETYKLGGYSHENYAEYANGSKELAFTLPNTPFGSQKTVYKSIFNKPTPDITSPGRSEPEPNGNTLIQLGSDVPVIPIYTTHTTDWSDEDATTVEPVKRAETKFYRVIRVDGHVTLKREGASSHRPDNVPILTEQGVKINKSLSEEQSNAVARVFKEPRTMRVELFLTKRDVEVLDSKSIIYLKQFGRYFYVNKILNFQSDKITTVVELTTVYPEK